MRVTPCWISGMVSAIDINKGRLRILKEAAMLHHVDNVITIIHADLRIFSVSFHPWIEQLFFLTFDLLLLAFLIFYFRKIIPWNVIKFYWMLHVLDWAFSPRWFTDMNSNLFLYQVSNEHFNDWIIHLFDILKRADLRWNRKLEDMEQLKNLQDELFDAASLYD